MYIITLSSMCDYINALILYIVEWVHQSATNHCGFTYHIVLNFHIVTILYYFANKFSPSVIFHKKHEIEYSRTFRAIQYIPIVS